GHSRVLSSQFSERSLSLDRELGTENWFLQFSPPQRSGRTHAGFEFLSQRAGVQQVEEALHLARESFTVAEPPDFFHARNHVAVEILHAHHFFQAPAPMRATQATQLHAAMWSFADAET